MATRRRTTPPERETLQYDGLRAKQAFDDTQALRASMPKTEAPKIDLADAAIFAVGIDVELQKADAKALFTALPASHFDIALVARVPQSGWALWYADTALKTATAASSEARVSSGLVELATAIKQRMLGVAEFALVDDEAAMLEVAAIRPGTGHKDLATDLSRLATLYEAHEPTVSQVGPRYRPTDPTDARRAAGQILVELGLSSAAAVQQRDDATRAFRVLETTYDQLRRVALAFLEDAEERFPPLYSIRPRTGSGKGGNGGGGEGEGGGNGGGATD